MRSIRRPDLSPRQRLPSGGEAGTGLPEAALEVLTALGASLVVLGPGDDVRYESEDVAALGVLRNGRVAADALLALTRGTRRDGVVRTTELELARGPLGGETLSVSAQATRLDDGLVLLLLEDRTEARRLDAVRRDFVANVSHELKTPVGALALLAEAICEATDDPEAVKRFAGRMQHEASRLGALVGELIELSRLQDRDPVREAVEVDVDDVVGDALDRCRFAAHSKSISLVYHGGDEVYVLGDEEQLVTALRNLVMNAISYSPQHTKVTLALRRAGELAEITVTDQGIGIPEADIDRIFERFYRVDPARSRATGGTGLGLAIVKHVAAVHGGDVSVWSVEGAGSTFTLRLPALRENPVAQLDSAADLYPAPEPDPADQPYPAPQEDAP